MLPSGDRTFTIAITKYIPLKKRGVAVPSEPKTLGEHLRRRRHELGLFQPEVAKKLKVSQRTLSLWEWDKVYPVWEYQPRLIEYLEYDPFVDPALGRPLGNESSDVAILLSKKPSNWGQRLRKRRLELKKNRKDLAAELGLSEKTLLNWETGRREPMASLKEKVTKFLNLPET